MKKPEQKDYGYVDGGIEEPTGWAIEGGEEAYNDAKKEWYKYVQDEQDMRKLAFDFMEHDDFTSGFPDDYDSCIYIMAQFGSYIKSINAKG